MKIVEEKRRAKESLGGQFCSLFTFHPLVIGKIVSGFDVSHQQNTDDAQLYISLKSSGISASIDICTLMTPSCTSLSLLQILLYVLKRLYCYFHFMPVWLLWCAWTNYTGWVFHIELTSNCVCIAHKSLNGRAPQYLARHCIPVNTVIGRSQHVDPHPRDSSLFPPFEQKRLVLEVSLWHAHRRGTNFRQNLKIKTLHCPHSEPN